MGIIDYGTHLKLDIYVKMICLNKNRMLLSLIK